MVSTLPHHVFMAPTSSFSSAGRCKIVLARWQRCHSDDPEYVQKRYKTMRCAICQQPIELHEYSVATFTGGRVHISCADRAAQLARRARTKRMVFSSIFLMGLLVAVAVLGKSILFFALWCLLVGGVHFWLNHRWWRLFVQSTHLHWYWIRSKLRQWRR